VVHPNGKSPPALEDSYPRRKGISNPMGRQAGISVDDVPRQTALLLFAGAAALLGARYIRRRYRGTH
jgi:hypothetical protein